MSAIESVVATINGQQYTLTYNATSKKYETTITAPSETSYNVNDGHYYPITIKATDAAGNVVTVNDSTETLGSNLRLRVKETVKPVINLTSIGAGAILTNNVPVFKFTVTDSGSGVATGTVKMKIDNKAVTLPTPTKISNGYEYNYTSSTLSDGSHTVVINASDNDGNAATEFSRTFTVDTVPPTLNITNPVNGFVTNQKTITVSGTTNDATSSPVTVAITVNGTDVGAVTVASDGAFNKSVTLSEGNNTIVVTSTDRAGKKTTVQRTVELDTSVPVFTSVTVSPNPVETGKTYTITVEVNS